MKTASWLRSFFLLIIVGHSFLPSLPAWGGTDATRPKVSAPDLVSYAKLPLSFEENQGQIDAKAKYVARGLGYTLFLTSREAVVDLGSPRSGAGGNSRPIRDSLLRLQLVGISAHAAVRGADELAGKANYFIGNDPSKWRTNVPTYARVKYADIYPGVDLVYYGNQDGQLECDFEVAPGADPKAIALEVGAPPDALGSPGHVPLRLDSNGDLTILLGKEEVRFRKPVIYQPASGPSPRTPVEGRYVLTSSHQVRFSLGAYDHTKALVIDPTLSYSTYLGGNGGETAYGIAVDSSGDAYVTGTTASLNFPITSGEAQTTYGGDTDAFVTEFNPAGTAVLQSTYIGGAGADIPSGIVLDASGNILIAGTTYSPNYPVTSGAYQTAYGGNGDAFVTKLNPSGSTLLYSTYLGGSNQDNCAGLTVDSAGNAFLVGSTQSTNFPTMNPLQLGLDGTSNAFVAELNPTGTVLLYSTYLGGSTADYGTGIALDTNENVYICGFTYSKDFPTQSALQSALAGGSDAFVTEFKPGSAALLFSTYLGGTGNDTASALAVDAAGSIYVTGETQSTNFPVTSNAFQATNNGGPGDAFVTKFTPGGTALVYSTYLGGSEPDLATALALDASGDVFLTGSTQSSDFPLFDPLQKVLGISGAGTCGSTSTTNLPAAVVCPNAFVARLGPSGIPVYSTFLGGSNTNSGQAIAIDSAGAAYVAGGTASLNFPVTVGAYQWLFGAGAPLTNAFVAKLSLTDGPSVVLSPQQINFGNQALTTTSSATLVTLTNEGSTALQISSITASGSFSQKNTCGTSVSAGGQTCTIQAFFAPTQTGLQTNEIVITDNAAGSPHLITVTGNGILAAGSLITSPTSLTFPPQTVNTTSLPQTVTIINNGYQAVTLNNLTVTGNFAETNTCGGLPTYPTVLNVGQSCTLTVTFTPLAGGKLAGSIEISSTAATGTVGVNLSGTGTPVFSLSANTRSNVLLIGTTTTSFTITAAGPSTFLYPITISCSGVTCTSNPTSILPGQSSVVTVTGLSAISANPTNFTVTGTGESQTASVALAIFFADFSIAATPTGSTVVAGSTVSYTITVTPINGFNQVVLLSCSNPPLGVTSTFLPPGVTLNGSANATSTLSLQTTAEGRLVPWRPPSGAPPGWVLRILILILTLLVAWAVYLGRTGRGFRPHWTFMVLFMALVLVALGAGCENYVNPINITPVVSGTPAGNFTIAVSGTLGTASSVTRTTTINLSVRP